MKLAHIVHILISPGHNYVGHHGGPSGEYPVESVPEARLLAGRGIEGDRYAELQAGHPKQITFFDAAVLDALSRAHRCVVPPASVRRNVIVRGLDLPTLVGRRFRLQGAFFEGVDPCKPCYWMDEAVGPGAEDFLKSRGGLRARILGDGVLYVGAAEFELMEDPE